MKQAIPVTIIDPRGRKTECQSLTQAWFATGLSLTTLRKLLNGNECPEFPGWRAEYKGVNNNGHTTN